MRARPIASGQGSTDVDLQLLCRAYDRLPLNMSLAIGSAAFIGLAGKAVLPQRWLFAWCGSVVAGALGGLIVWAAFRRAAPDRDSVPRWRLLFLLHAVTAGLSWAVGPVTILPHGRDGMGFALIGILITVCAVPMASYLEEPRGIVAFAVSALLPTAIACFWSDDPRLPLGGIVVACALAAFVFVSRDPYRGVRGQLETQARLQSILDTSHDAIVGLDVAGRITDWNARAEAMFQFTKREALGRSLADTIVPPQLRAGYEADLAAHVEVGGRLAANRRTDTTFVRKDGEELAAELVVTRTSDRSGEGFALFVTDVSERKAAEERLELFRRVFQASAQGIAIGDATGRLLFVNDAFRTLLEPDEGAASVDPVGAPYLRFLPPDTARAEIVPIRRALATSGEWGGLLTLQRNDGTRFVSVSNVGVIRGPQGEVQYLFNLFGDFSGELARREELARAKIDADRANAAKSEFLSSMSHELRTPLNAVLGFAQILEHDRALSFDQHDSVQEILKGGRHLLKLIGDVLDLAKIESGHLDISPERVVLAELLHECFSLIQPLALQRGVTLRDDLDPRATIRADRVRFRQAVLNLLSNAVKYNREGGTIDVSAEPAGADRLRLSVRDTGPGIASARLPELFQPFSRLDAERSDVEGTGIGLTITRRLIERMGGVVGVESEVGVGSCFWIEIPTEPDEPTTDPTVQGRHTSVPAKRPCEGRSVILCVDDNATNLRIVTELLAVRADLEVITAADADAGLALAELHRPAVVLLDLHLPGPSGYDLLARFRAHASLSAVRVVALTASAMPEERARGQRAGFDDYLTKPVDRRALLAALDRCLVASEEESP